MKLMRNSPGRLAFPNNNRFEARRRSVRRHFWRRAGDSNGLGAKICPYERFLTLTPKLRSRAAHERGGRTAIFLKNDTGSQPSWQGIVDFS
jgi:hypothetical protein